MVNFKNYLILAGAGLIVTLYKIFKSISDGKKLKMATVISKVLLALIISLLVIPKAMNYFNWNIETALTANAIVNLFSEGIMKILEKKVYEKLEDKLDKHL
jgi:hypothetical protein